MPIVFDGRLAKKVRRIFQADTLVVTRMASTVDAEGDATTGRIVVPGVTKGTLHATTETEDLAALQRGTRVDKALQLELGLDLRGGDWVTVLGLTYEVVEIAPKRLSQRALLQVVV